MTTASSSVYHLRRRIVQNFLLIWIDTSIDESTQDCKHTLAQLQTVVNDVHIFTKRDEGIDFLTELHGMKAFLVVEGTIGRRMMPLIHDIPQLDTIHILCGNRSQHEEWTKNWGKIKGVHTDINSICQALQITAKQCNQDSIAVSFVTVDETAPNADLNQLEPSFMYTQIFKEILLEMKNDEQSIKHFTSLWRDNYINNMVQLNVITEFERNYCSQSSVWWYTREYFIYQMLNQALRLLEADTIINMGFFIRDLHQQIEQLHQKQADSYHGKPFIVYRGQGLLKTDFEKLLKTKGGLMSFNNFLSTSPNRDVSLIFAESVPTNTDMVGILFKMTIDASVSSAPFASIQEVSYFQAEEEILFSMHTVFRIGEIKENDNNSSLYQVDLQLTADDDQQLRTLTERIQEEAVGALTVWERLGHLLLKIGQFDKAEELYNILLEQACDEGEKAIFYHALGYIREQQGDHKKAIEYYKKALEIWQKTLPPNHLHLAASYDNIGTVYKNIGEYSKARSSYEKALEIFKKILPPNHRLLAASYNNIGLLYDNMGEYSKALSFYEKVFKMRQKTLPPNHPDLAGSYNSIGMVYKNIGEYSKALSFFEKAVEIYEKSLHRNHPLLATSYNNIGSVNDIMGEYSKALSFYERALEIYEKSLHRNHPLLATSYNNIGSVYYNMGEYSKALSFFEKALQIFEKTLPQNHPDLASAYNNIGSVYNMMGDYSKAPSFFEKALEIRQKTLPPNHPSLATSYISIGLMSAKMREYSKALSFYQRALNILQSSLPPSHPNIKTVLEIIEVLKKRM